MDGLLDKGRQLVVLCPSADTLTLGIVSEIEPETIPQVIAFKRKEKWTPSPNHELTVEEQAVREEAFQRALATLGLDEGGLIGDTVETMKRELVETIPNEEKILTGNAVYDLSTRESYDLVFPCHPSGMHPARSALQLRNNLGRIWSAAMIDTLHVKPEQCQQMGVVLIVPDNYSLGDVEVMIDVIFHEMQFKEVVVHSDSMAAVFGQGLSSACVVNIDDASIRVRCIEDGVLLSGSPCLLPFGGRHICHAMEWMLRKTFPVEFRSRERPCDRQQLEIMRDAVCFLPQEGTESALAIQIRNIPPINLTRVTAGQGKQEQQIQFGSTSFLAPMGLFYPEIMRPHSLCTPSRLKSQTEEHYQQITADPEGTKQSKTFPECPCRSLPLDEAIVKSISSVQNVDHRRRFYTSILVTGACSRLKGLSDMLERCVLSALPPDEVIDTVAVVEGKTASDKLIWKGGTVLGLLSDNWVSREEWIHGVNVEKPNRFGKREIARSKVFWLFKTEIGMM